MPSGSGLIFGRAEIFWSVQAERGAETEPSQLASVKALAALQNASDQIHFAP